MTDRSREIDTLFQRMATKVTAAPDPVIEDDAARAVAEWPLLAMLTHVKPAPVSVPRARPIQHMMMPVEVEEPVVLDTPIAAADPMPLTPEPYAAPPSHSLSPLEQLFMRAEQTGKPQAAQPSVFAAAPAPAIAPPPLKTPAQPAQTRRLPFPPLTAPAAVPQAAPRTAQAADSSAVTIEPKPHQWRELDTVPERLFERVGAR